jgi:diguanylate cyclase (GGDEF)-like protein
MPMKKRARATAAKASERRRKGAVRPKVEAKAAPKSKPAARAEAEASRTRSDAGDGARESIRSLRRDLARALARIDELEAVADTDSLLDVPNRRGFERALDRAIAYIKRYHASGALIVLDVDRLKPINDAFGHAAGDQVLKTIAATLVRQVRSSDVVGRLGGDEFAVLLWNLTETDAKAKAAALERAIDELEFAFGDGTVTAGASAGVALLGPHSEADRVMEQADAAMYVRKAQRRHEAGSQDESALRALAR